MLPNRMLPREKIIARCFHVRPSFRARAMQWCNVNFSSEDPSCHGNQPFLFKGKIDCRLAKASNAKTQLVGYIAWQWDRYLVPQNEFLVLIKNITLCLDSVSTLMVLGSTRTAMHNYTCRLMNCAQISNI